MDNKQKINLTLVSCVLLFLVVQVYHIFNGKIGPPPLVNSILLYHFLIKRRTWAKIVFIIFGGLECVICVISVLMTIQYEVLFTASEVSIIPYDPYLWITDLVALVAYIIPFVVFKKVYDAEAVRHKKQGGGKDKGTVPLSCPSHTNDPK